MPPFVRSTVIPDRDTVPVKLLQRISIAVFAAILPWGALAAPGVGSNIRLPEIGEAGASTITPEEEYKLGEEIVRKIRAAGMIIEDPLVDEYINNLGFRIASNSGHGNQRFSFFAVNSTEINAFALPGGFIGINGGLLIATDSESELAGVMAHEVAHVTQKHIARRFEASTGMNLATLASILGALAIGMSGADADVTNAAIAVAQAGAIQRQINFTRTNEYEADRVGISILAAANFNPNGMISFFEKLQRKYRYISSYAPEYLSTHPLSLSRISEARQRVREYSDQDYSESRLYPIIKARLKVLMSDEPHKLPIQFEQEQDTHTSIQNQARRYGLAMSYTKLEKHEQAAGIFRQLLNEDETMIPYYIGFAESLAGSGNPEAAFTIYEEALSIFPGNVPLVLSYASQLLQQKQADKAQGLFLKLLSKTNQDPALFRKLAHVSQQKGNAADSHYYMAEYYFHSGDLRASLIQIRLALAQPELSELQKARYEAKLKQLETRWASLPLRERLEQENDGRGQ